MSKVTDINKHISKGMTMGDIAFRYYQIVKPEKKYSIDSARNYFVRDSKIDFKVLRKVVTDIYYDQLGLINIIESKWKQ